MSSILIGRKYKDFRPGPKSWSESRASPWSDSVFVNERRVAEVRQFVVTTSRSEIESGSATLSTPPVKARLSGAAKLCIGISICVAAWYTYMLILLRGMD